jgi:hypothetical protein
MAMASCVQGIWWARAAAHLENRLVRRLEPRVRVALVPPLALQTHVHDRKKACLGWWMSSGLPGRFMHMRCYYTGGYTDGWAVCLMLGAAQTRTKCACNDPDNKCDTHTFIDGAVKLRHIVAASGRPCRHPCCVGEQVHAVLDAHCTQEQTAQQSAVTKLAAGLLAPRGGGGASSNPDRHMQLSSPAAP